MSKKLSLLSLVILTLSSMIGAFAPQPASALSGSDLKQGALLMTRYSSMGRLCLLLKYRPS